MGTSNWQSFDQQAYYGRELLNLVGLLLITLSSHTAVLLIGIFGAGTGFVLISQSTVAWVKNLYPAEQRGQFEGGRMIFAVCVPMVFGPLLSSYLINKYGVYMEIDGVSGMVPTEMLFAGSAIVTLFTFLPLIPAARCAGKASPECRTDCTYDGGIMACSIASLRQAIY